MFSRAAIGMSISPAGIALAQMGGPVSSARLEKLSRRALPPGILHPSMRERNIANAPGFLNALKETRNSLLSSCRRVVLSLPESVGHVLLLDVEEKFRNRMEGLDILRWKLKKRLPFDSSDIHLDYQQVATRSNGDMVIMVVVVVRAVIAQYEEMLTAAGLEPVRIDLNCFNLFRVFDRRLSPHDDYALVTYFDDNLGVMFFAGGSPEFIRIKEISEAHADESRLHKEIKCSYLSFRSHFPEPIIGDVFCLAPPGQAGSFRSIVSDAMGCDTILLETRTAVTTAEGIPSDQDSLFPFTAAIGAALREL
jgi:type IV pilus assembly protein PilM